MNHDELTAAVRQMPWKHVVRLLKDTVIQYQPAPEIPKVIADWFDVNRLEFNQDIADALLERIKQTSAISPDAMKEFGEAHERAPVGPWWCAVSHYIRDGKRYWLLRMWLDDDREVFSATKEENHRLRKIVAEFGGNGKRPLLCTGAQWFFTWRA